MIGEDPGMQSLYPNPLPKPDYTPLTDVEWEALYVEYGVIGGPPGSSEDPEADLVPRRRRSSPECEEIAFEENRLKHEMDKLALGRAGPSMPGSEVGPDVPGPSRARSPSLGLDEEPSPKRPCMGSDEDNLGFSLINELPNKNRILN